jgi:surface polysaccharide O-acyltransferase-like enzyme
MSETLPVQDANKGRMLFADVTRAAAILMVILLHSSALYFYQDGTPLRWHFANFVNSFTRPAVPLFLMLSGALLLSPDRKETPLKFLKHQFSKILPSLLFWSVFYYLIGAYGAGAAFSVSAFFDGLVRGNLYYHLSFLYYLLGLYFTYPLLRSFFRGANQGEGSYFLAVWIATIVTAGVSNFFGFGISANLLIFFSFIGFPVAGWMIHSFEGTDRFLKMAAVVFLLGWLATILLTWYQKATGAYAEFFYEYLSLNVVFSSLAMFYLFRFIDWNSLAKGSVHRFVSIISTHSFDVFLIHPFILLVLKVYIVPQRLTVHAFSGILILFFLTSLLSVLSAMILDFLKTIIRTKIKQVLPGAA